MSLRDVIGIYIISQPNEMRLYRISRRERPVCRSDKYIEHAKRVYRQIKNCGVRRATMSGGRIDQKRTNSIIYESRENNEIKF